MDIRYLRASDCFQTLMMFTTLRTHKYMKGRIAIIASIALMMLAGCSGKSNASQPTADSLTDTARTGQTRKVPTFNADSAYHYTWQQCSFGARVPNSKAHGKCLKYICGELERMGAKVNRQETTLIAYDGTRLQSTNIIASYYPDNNRRIALFAHWDCRPMADNDPLPANRHKPVMGANDAASGVAVLMELGRLLQKEDPGVGIDLILVDAEDYGAPDNAKMADDERTWCLGTQYWCKNMGYRADNKPYMGILLDMVGGDDPEFSIDAASLQYAGPQAQAFWNDAASIGLGDFFSQNQGGSIIDDHYFVNLDAGIPTFDIIDFRSGRGFPKEWHTASDDMSHISRSTLGAVGKALTHYIFTQSAQ